MINYSKGQPVGNNGVPQFEAPAPVLALARNGNTSQTVSSVTSLTQDTTAIEIAVQGAAGAVMKWVATTDTGASVFGISSVGATNAPNFDHAIPANTVRRFVVPMESMTQWAGSVQQGANRLNGLYQRVAIASGGGVSSVLLTEY